MKSISLLLLRLSTGLYIIFWGIFKLTSTGSAVSVSKTYYFGLLNSEYVNYVLGSLEIMVGVMVILGLKRQFSYLAQSIIYFAGLATILPYILDPFGLYFVENAKLTFFPSTTLFFASLVLLSFKSDDLISIDHKIAR